MSPPGRHRPEADGLRQATDRPQGLPVSGLSPRRADRRAQHTGRPVRGVRWLSSLALAGGLVLAAPAQAAEDTRFLSGPELGQALQRNVVRVRTLDLNEQGFGLVVAVTSQQVLIATARHVVLADAGLAPDGFDPRQRRIDIAFCAGDDSGAGPHAAELVTGFDAGGHDIALLRVRRPAGYQPEPRALAPAASLALRQEAWLLGQDQQCGLAPRSGAVAALPNARGDLRIEFPGVRGGASGGPALGGQGVLGLVTQADDQTFTVHGVASLEALVRAHDPGAWALVDARNIPPGEPRAAEVDLAETLNQYLFAAHDLQGLLLQVRIERQNYFNFAQRYSAVVRDRYAPASERHDGSLRRHWPPAVLTQWQALRRQLWAVHEAFLALNDGESRVIFETGRAPPAVQQRMQALAPDLAQLRASIAEFLRALAQRTPS